jgi:hypothetical protein
MPAWIAQFLALTLCWLVAGAAGTDSSEAGAINNREQVVGQSGGYAFVWQGRTGRAISARCPSGSQSVAWGTEFTTPARSSVRAPRTLLRRMLWCGSPTLGPYPTTRQHKMPL